MYLFNTLFERSSLNFVLCNVCCALAEAALAILFHTYIRFTKYHEGKEQHWRGSVVECILDFHAQYPEVRFRLKP